MSGRLTLFALGKFAKKHNLSIDWLLSGDLKWKDFVTPYRGPKAFYDLDFHDPRLAATTVALCGRYVVGNLLRHWKLRSPGT